MRAYALALAATLAASSAYAGGFSNPDFGIRRLGMFAVLAKPDDPTAVFHNPAGLTLNTGTQLYHHESWFISDIAFRFYDSEGKLRPDHEITPDWNVGAIPFIGIASDVGTEKLRLGLGIYAPNAYGAKLPKDEPTRYHATSVLFLASRATGSAAYIVSDKLSVGASLSLIHVYLGAERYLNPTVLADPDARFNDPKDNAALDAKLELGGQDLTWAVDFGVLLHPTKTFDIGLMFAGGSNIDLEGDVKLTYADGRTEKTTQTTDMVIPFSVGAGINWEFAPEFEFAADIRYWHYQVLQEQRSVLDEPIMGIGQFVDPKNYGNSWNWCVGLMYHLSPELELMTGYQEDYTPIPEETYALDNPSRDQRGISAGARYQLTDNVKVGVAGVRNWFDLVNVQTSLSSPPSNIKGHGGNTEVGFDVSWTL